ncbi:hypothetical protein JCGZ_16619 [Jatropha curcas]|uniref:SUEL-type lectin domain-containing protein n=1 Tax=Jatropha curcas TaxID=180498 RepID=A0A067KAG1_JATCU|nr:hypothetical protein JCGZ_16619 [Jatropha curcas]
MENLAHGYNRISLLGATVGFAGYGFSGPIKLIATYKNSSEPEAVKDISTSKWVFKTGLHGEDAGYHQSQPKHLHQWSNLDRPINRPFTWYKTNFITPGGTDPVAVDLNGMGKGVAWINGINIESYKPREKCNTGCGEPTQRHYHPPRDWLRPENNVLVLFEELGGNAENIQIQSVTIGKICAHADEGQTLEISCQGGHRIKEITFASFGDVNGRCGSFSQGNFYSENALSIVQKACLKQK